MGYWLGSGVDAVELEMTVLCKTCDDYMDNVTIYAEGSIGVGECPICETEIEVEV